MYFLLHPDYQFPFCLSSRYYLYLIFSHFTIFAILSFLKCNVNNPFSNFTFFQISSLITLDEHLKSRFIIFRNCPHRQILTLRNYPTFQQKLIAILYKFFIYQEIKKSQFFICLRTFVQNVKFLLDKQMRPFTKVSF